MSRDSFPQPSGELPGIDEPGSCAREAHARSPFRRLWPLRAVVFLGAFLLFQIELILSKALLPGFGGSYLVWGSCMFFFQVVLLAGYWASHWATARLDVKLHGLLQAVLPLPALLLLPANLDGLTPSYHLPFIAEIFRFLLVSIGGAFFVLSTVGVTVQRFLAATDRPEASDPHFLYGTSNLGSFLALVSYPFLVEPLFDLNLQFSIWKAGFVVLGVLQAPVVLLLARQGRDVVEEADAGQSASRLELLWWFVLAAAGSAMMMASTNLITIDLAAVPLLWILPLGLYLLTFYLNFKLRPWCPHWIKDRFYIILPLGLYFYLLTVLGYQLPLALVIGLHLTILFIFCMFCQNELVLSRPQSPRRLTAFYLTLAGGGAGGTLLVSLGAPLTSPSMVEYPAALLLATLAVLLKSRDWRWRWKDLIGLAAALPVLAWPHASSQAPDVTNLTAAGFGLVLVATFAIIGRDARPGFLALAAVTTALFLSDYAQVEKGILYHQRNFYGIYRIHEEGGKRLLRHGVTLHGSQYLDPARSAIPQLYYHPTTPAGELLSSGLFDFRDMGIIGLGTGSLAAYAHPGTRLHFYELDPDNLGIAKKYFSFLGRSPADIRYTFGDARLSLTRNPKVRHDLLIVDAFNSDSIPVHLITVEAIRLYRQRLAPDGAILFHISNRFLTLAPMLRANAALLGLHVLYKANLEAVAPDAAASEWVVMTGNPALSLTLVEKLRWSDLLRNPGASRVAPWTDQYSNLLSALLAQE